MHWHGYSLPDLGAWIRAPIVDALSVSDDHAKLTLVGIDHPIDPADRFATRVGLNLWEILSLLASLRSGIIPYSLDVPLDPCIHTVDLDTDTLSVPSVTVIDDLGEVVEPEDLTAARDPDMRADIEPALGALT